MLTLALLVLALVMGMLLVPLGLPGLWLMLGATFVHYLAVPGGSIGVVTLLVVGALVVAAEVAEFAVAGRYARKYGGSRRASWGAVLGGLAGAVVGVPIPLIGSMVGALAGAFGGAFVAEMTVARDRRGAPVEVATGAIVGRAVAAALKVGIGLVIMVWVVAAALVGVGSA